jgi:hypothetical protein
VALSVLAPCREVSVGGMEGEPECRMWGCSPDSVAPHCETEVHGLESFLLRLVSVPPHHQNTGPVEATLSVWNQPVSPLFAEVELLVLTLRSWSARPRVPGTHTSLGEVTLVSSLFLRLLEFPQLYRKHRQVLKKIFNLSYF